MQLPDFSKYAIKLSAGSHKDPEHGLCVMECVAYIQGEYHSDRPMCADPVISDLCISLNDIHFSDIDRQELLSFIFRIAGSKASREIELKRIFILASFIAKKLNISCHISSTKDLVDFFKIIRVRSGFKYHFIGSNGVSPVVSIVSIDLVNILAILKSESYFGSMQVPISACPSKTELLDLLDSMLKLTESVEVTPVIETKLKELVTIQM